MDWFPARAGVTRSNTFGIAQEGARSPGTLTHWSVQDSDWSQRSLHKLVTSSSGKEEVQTQVLEAKRGVRELSPRPGDTLGPGRRPRGG